MTGMGDVIKQKAKMKNKWLPVLVRKGSGNYSALQAKKVELVATVFFIP